MPVRIERILTRPDFLAARAGRRLNGPFFFVETRDRADGGAPRLGLTVTKKVGNAVVRNRIRRRLREAVRTASGADMISGFDYVIVARREVLDLPFERLTSELSRRFVKLAPGGNGRSGTDDASRADGKSRDRGASGPAQGSARD